VVNVVTIVPWKDWEFKLMKWSTIVFVLISDHKNAAVRPRKGEKYKQITVFKEESMAFGKRIGLSGLKYKGGGTMLAWLFHRIGGVAMVIFIGTHILASFSNQQLGNDLGAQLNLIYTSTRFQAVLYFFVLFHTINGLRIILLDLWPQFLKYQREATWVQWALFIPLYGMVLYFMIVNSLAGG